MDHPATPSTGSQRSDGNSSVRSRSRRKSPGDALGIGKSQIPITRYYSSASSSERSSQPGKSAKRRANPDSPTPNKRRKASDTVTITSDDSDDVFTDSQPPRLRAVPHLSRIHLVKRCLYPETSQNSGKNASGPKKKRLSKPKHLVLDERNTSINSKPSQVLRPSSQMTTQKKQRSEPKLMQTVRILSSDDSDEEVPHARTDPKSFLNLRASSPMPHKNQCPDMSQSVIISSSDDSDFELHNSKQSQSFASQAFGNDAPRPSQSFLSRQMNQNQAASSPLLGFTETPKLPSKRRSPARKVCSDSAPRKDNNKSAHSLRDESFPSAAIEKASQLDETIDANCKNSSYSMPPKTEFESDDNNSTIAPSPIENGLPSIYLQETLPPPHHDTHFQPSDKIDENFLPTPLTPSSLRSSTISGESAEKTVDPSIAQQPFARGSSIYNQETVDPAFNSKVEMDLDRTVEDSFPDSTDGLAQLLEAALLSPEKGGVIECSDGDLDESAVTYKSHIGLNPDSSSLGVTPLSEFSHISGSDDDLPHELCLDSDESVIEPSIGMFPIHPGSVSPLSASRLMDDSNDSSAGITSIMNAVLDVSADFFSDVVSSFGTGLSSDDPHVQGKGVQTDDTDTALRSEDVEKQNSALDRGSVDFVEAESTVSRNQDQAMNPAVPGDCLTKAVDPFELRQSERERVDELCPVNDSSSTIVADVSGSPDGLEPKELASEETADPALLQTSIQNQTACSKTALDDKPLEVESSLVGTPGICSRIGSRLEGNPSVLPSTSDAWPVDVGSCSSEVQAAVDSANAPSNGPSTTANNIPNEIKIVCGTVPLETSPKLHIAHNLDKSLLYNPKRPLLLDAILSECQNYADAVLNLEPIKTFVSKYSSLPPSSKSALHSCLLELLEDSNRWLKYSETSSGSIDDVVSSGILEHLNTNDNLITKLNALSFYELNDIFLKLEAHSGANSELIELMRNKIYAKLTSTHVNDSVKKEIVRTINRKFIKLTEGASFCLKICLELFVLPLNLNDKLYKASEIARFVNSLIRAQSCSKSTLPLATSKMSADPSRVLSDLSELCRLKSKVFNSELSDESIYHRLNDICSTIAVMDASAETDSAVKNGPTFRFLLTNYVHALDETLKKWFYANCSDIDFGACIYLGFLLKQDVTGYQHKVKWCRERMRYLLKLLDSGNIFEEFSKTLKEPVPPVEFYVRSEFVFNAMKIKKLGLTTNEKSHLTTLLRPTVHPKAQIALLPLNATNYYEVLTKKPKIKNFELIRRNIFEKFNGDFPFGVEDNGVLLVNAVFMAFWRAIYLPLDGAFVSNFQKSPVDWGSEQFFARRQIIIQALALEITKRGMTILSKLLKTIFDKFSYTRSVVDWGLVSTNIERINSLVETLGVDRFLKIAVHVLGKSDERILGFPDVVLWNPETKRVKFVGLKKPADPTYPYQILWLERLADFGAEAEEIVISGYGGQEQCSQLK